VIRESAKVILSVQLTRVLNTRFMMTTYVHLFFIMGNKSHNFPLLGRLYRDDGLTTSDR
jgi:hypothetical protein